MNAERMKILDMLAAGKINAKEANELLSTIEGSAGPTVSETSTAKQPKFLCVKVMPKNSSGDKVNVRVPLQILRSGIKLASLIPSEAKATVSGALNEHGLKIDLDKLKPEQLEEIVQSLGEMSVDVDNADETVKICCE